MRRALKLVLAIFIGYAVVAVISSVWAFTPVGDFLDRISPLGGESFFVRETAHGTEINLPFILGTLIMGAVFSAGVYGALKD